MSVYLEVGNWSKNEHLAHYRKLFASATRGMIIIRKERATKRDTETKGVEKNFARDTDVRKKETP